jgi:hypothetical protein
MTIFGDGSQKRAFSYIDDCLEPIWNAAIYKAASKQIINIGGIIIIDDIRYPSISKLMRYIINYPCYEMIGHVGIEKSKKRKLYDLIDILPFRIFSKLFPRKLRYKYFSSKIINSDKELNLQSSMVAFRKISDDERSFRWFKEF